MTSELDKTMTSQEKNSEARQAAKRNFLIGGALVAAVLGLSIYLHREYLAEMFGVEKRIAGFNGHTDGDDDVQETLDLVRDMMVKGVKCYGQTSCPATKRQRDLFGGRHSKQRAMFENNLYVECRGPDECPGIVALPTWRIAGVDHRGLRSLQDLRELITVALKEAAVPECPHCKEQKEKAAAAARASAIAKKPSTMPDIEEVDEEEDTEEEEEVVVVVKSVPVVARSAAATAPARLAAVPKAATIEIVRAVPVPVAAPVVTEAPLVDIVVAVEKQEALAETQPVVVEEPPHHDEDESAATVTEREPAPQTPPQPTIVEVQPPASLEDVIATMARSVTNALPAAKKKATGKGRAHRVSAD